jgi:hypothetical protein
MPVGEFAALVDQVIVSGPQVIIHEHAQPDAVFLPALDAAMYLDSVLGEGPSQDIAEAHQLAAAYAVLLREVPVDDLLLSDLLQLARGRESVAERIRGYLEGSIDRSGLERFIVRRPWPEELQRVITSLPDSALESFACALVANDWRAIHALLSAAA